MAAAGKTLTKKMTRHESKSTDTPPIRGATMAAALVHADHLPMAAPCAALSKWLTISASELGTRSAPATPCSPRLTTSISPVHAAPQRTEVRANPPSPHCSTRTRPK